MARTADAKGSDIFLDSSQVYSTIGKAIEQFVDEEKVAPLFKKESVSIGILLIDPRATIVLSLGKSNREVSFGEVAATPDSAVALTANAAHELLSGRRNLGRVTAANEIDLVGDRSSLAILLSFPERVRPYYKVALVNQRRSDLLVDWDKEPPLRRRNEPIPSSS